MSRSQRHPVIAIAAATTGLAAGVAAGLVADRASRHRAALEALETTEPLALVPDEERIVLTPDGVGLHVEIDVPTPEAAAAAARDVAHRGDPDHLPTVVLTHGYSLSLKCWVFQRRALKAAGYRVVSWDQRGHGRSSRGEPETYVIDQLGSDLRTVIADTVPTGDVVLVGHSMGGMTMLALGELDPDLVRDRATAAAFIGTSPGGLTLANGGRSATIARMLLERLGPTILGPLAERPTLWGRIRRAGRDAEDLLVEQYAFASPVPRSVLRYTADILMGTPLDVVNDFLKTFNDYDKRSALAVYGHTPTLVFNGEEDVLTPPEHSDLIVEGIPGAEHVVVNEAGHIIMLEHPDLLNTNLLQLIEQGTRARAEQIDVTSQPRVRRFVTDIAKERRQRRLERRAEEIVRADSPRNRARRARALPPRAVRDEAAETPKGTATRGPATDSGRATTTGTVSGTGPANASEGLRRGP